MRLIWLSALVLSLASFVGAGARGSQASGLRAGRALTDPEGELFAVSCAGQSFCLAVGTAAASWDGHRWHTLEMPAPPAGTLNVFMNGVSCPAVDNCVVVGEFDTAAATLALAEHWNGKRWTALAVSSARNARLDTVACPSTSWCMAAGSTDASSTKTLAGIWNGPGGGGWHLTATPNVAGSSSNVFRQLSCASPTVCVGLASAVDRWNGEGWSTVATGRYAVNDVSCLPGADVADCTYLGFFGGGGAVYSDTLKDGSGGWQAVGDVHGSSKLTGNPAGYACAAANSCQAVGQQPLHRSGDVVAFAERWNGSRWAAVPAVSPNPPHQGLRYAAFFAVSCVAANNCAAVGRDNQDVLAEHWDGAHWIVNTFTIAPPSPAKRHNPAPPPEKTVSPVPGLVEQWNGCYQCNFTKTPNLLSPAVASHYVHLLEATEQALDGNGAEAAAFFNALSSGGLGHFGYASFKLGIGQGLVAGFPNNLVPTTQPDGIQLLGVAIASGHLTAAQATEYTLAVLDHSECASCSAGAFALSSPSLAAETLVFNWLHGQLLSKKPTPTEARLLDLGVSSPDGWNLVTVGASAFAIANLPQAAAPTVDDLQAWVDKVKNDVVTPIVDAEGANFVTQAQHDALDDQEAFAGWSAIATTGLSVAFPPAGVFSTVAGIALSLWGAKDTSGIPEAYGHAISDSNEAQADADLFCIEALLDYHRIIPEGSTGTTFALADTVENLQHIWEDFVVPTGANDQSVYAVNARVHPAGSFSWTPTTLTLRETPLGVPSFLSSS